MDFQNYTVEDFICDESFQRYCLGTDQEAIEFWESWASKNPHRSDEIREAERIIGILNAKQGNLQVQLVQLKDSIWRFDQLKEALRQNEPAIQENSPVRYFSRVKTISAIAASLLLLVVAGYFLFKPNPQKQATPERKALAEQPRIQSGNEPRKTIVLPDGSVVTLRSNSHITLASDFNGASRELALSGEAFFDVAHNEQRPFIVHTAEVNIEVLGTVFNVSAYPGNAQTETSLFRGKVAVSRKDNPAEKVILSPSQKLIYTNGGVAGATAGANPFKVVSMLADPVTHKAKEIAWVRNRLKIEDEPLETIAARLQEWYGINIRFADDEVKAYRYSGTFESESVVKALEALQLSYPFNFRVEKEQIVISK
jgi:transmembrane sensor